MKFDIFKKYIIIAGAIIINVSSTVIRSEGECVEPSTELFNALQFHANCINRNEGKCRKQCFGNNITGFCNSLKSYYNLEIKPSTTTTRPTKTINNLSCTCVPKEQRIKIIKSEFESSAKRLIQDCEKKGGSINATTLECEINNDVCKPLCYTEVFKKRCEANGMKSKLTLHTEDCGYDVECISVATTKTTKTIPGIPVTSSTTQGLPPKKRTTTTTRPSPPQSTSSITKIIPPRITTTPKSLSTKYYHYFRFNDSNKFNNNYKKIKNY
ncbi:hypothetical protein PIROE2DRAFT_58923 [Piromyces sp. E2]|nr:hypothetical protein PIROE2DRAFT_58923 [Piromyces sp. E2]|eukprot:OUM67157.1 hypothetical protein PIROE2DRAFT_58923 [Piromyces sp. E2]